MRDDELQMSIPHCVMSVTLSQSLSLEQDTESVSIISNISAVRMILAQNEGKILDAAFRI